MEPNKIKQRTWYVLRIMYIGVYDSIVLSTLYVVSLMASLYIHLVYDTAGGTRILVPLVLVHGMYLQSTDCVCV